jgi:hypothetical protein
MISAPPGRVNHDLSAAASTGMTVTVDVVTTMHHGGIMQGLRWHAPTDVPTEPPYDMQATTHRCRLALEGTLANPADETQWRSLAKAYSDMSDEWTAWAHSQHWYNAPVRAGLARAKRTDWAFEVCCGTGQATAPLTGVTPSVMATDINASMLTRAPALPEVQYVASDVRALPVQNLSVPLLVGLNAVPFVPELDRVIARDGQLLWCTSFGSGTPLYVEPDRLLRIFGEGWHGEAGRAGHGEWMLLSRVG